MQTPPLNHLVDAYVIDVDGPKLKPPVKGAMYKMLCANSSVAVVSVSHVPASEIIKESDAMIMSAPTEAGNSWMRDLKTSTPAPSQTDAPETKPSAANILGGDTSSAVQVVEAIPPGEDGIPDDKKPVFTHCSTKRIWAPPRVPQSVLWASLRKHQQMLLDFSDPANQDSYPDQNTPERRTQRESLSVTLAKASCDDYKAKGWTNATRASMTEIARVCFMRYLTKHKHVRFALEEEEEILENTLKLVTESGKVAFEEEVVAVTTPASTKNPKPEETPADRAKKGLTRRPFRKVTGSRSKIPPTWSKLVLNEEGDTVACELYACGGDGEILVLCQPVSAVSTDNRYLVGIYEAAGSGGGDSKKGNKKKRKNRKGGIKSAKRGERRERRRGGYVRVEELGSGPLAVEWARNKRGSVSYVVVGIRGGGARVITIPDTVKHLPERGSGSEWLRCTEVAGMETESSITSIRRVPGHQDVVLISHMDGTLHQLCVVSGQVKRVYGSYDQAIQTVLDGRFTVNTTGFPPDVLKVLPPPQYSPTPTQDTTDQTPLQKAMAKEPLLAGIALHSTGSFQSFWDGDLHGTVDPREKKRKETVEAPVSGEESSAVKWPYGIWHSNPECVTKLEGTNSILGVAAGVLPGELKRPMLMMTDPYGHMYFCQYNWTPRTDKTGWHISWDMVCPAIPPYKGLRTDPRYKTPMYLWSSTDGLGLAVGCHGNGCLRMVKVCEKPPQ